MQLQRVRITNFRSVEDSEGFNVDTVTCLVGKNEAGKSAVLLALAALNPSDATPVTLDRERDYPRRHLVRYGEIHQNEDAIVVRTTWKLDDSEIQAINSDIGENVLSSGKVDVIRRYNQDIEVSAQLSYEAVVKYLSTNFELDKSQRLALESADTMDKLTVILEDLKSSDEKDEQLEHYLTEDGGIDGRVQKYVVNALPKFMYVSSYDRMDGAIQIELAKDRSENGTNNTDRYRGERLFVDFLEYAGAPLDSIINETRFEIFNAKLQAASTNITDQILEFWSQNPDLDVDVRIDMALPDDPEPFNTGRIARARIKNNLHRVDTPFSERSAGFVWFFSFLVKFAQVARAGNPIILLLDEPGLSLHGKAQNDLLRFIDDKLAPSHQVIYSTHSPFMISPNKLERVRIVEDKVNREKMPIKSYGTKVSQEFLEVEADTLFPLQGALGYGAVQTLFVGEYTLLVEGPSDILYLQALSNTLGSLGRTKLDPRWIICPAGGIDKMMPFISLFSGKGLRIAVLTDFAHGVKSKVERMRNTNILMPNHFFTFADFTDKSEADVEDIFEPDVYADIVNRGFELQAPHCITKEKLNKNRSTTRLVKKVEALFRMMPSSIPEFDHYTPAAWLIRNPEILVAESQRTDQTLSVAENIFKALNKIL